MILKKALMILMLGSLFAFVACEGLIPAEEEEDTNPILGVWELDSMSKLDTAGELIVEQGEDNPMVFPMDYVVMVTQSATDHDIDNDGTDEVLTSSMLIEVTDTYIRMYADISLTDTNSVIPQYMTGINTTPGEYGLAFYADAIKYNSDDDVTNYTVSGSTITGMGEDDVTFSISGTTLTIDVPDDNKTTDTSDDFIRRMAFTKVTSSAIEGATNDTTISVFGDEEEQ